MSLSTSFKDLNRNFLEDREQPSSVIQFGQLALSGIPVSDLLKQAVAIISEMLVADCIWICELDAEGSSVVRQAGMGWKDGSLDLRSKTLEPTSLERFTLTTGAPVVVENLAAETKFVPSPLLSDHRIVSGISIPIGAPGKSLGLIEVFARQLLVFSREDCLLLQQMANLLGLSIQRARLEEENGKHPSGSEWDSYEIKNRLRESRENERLRLAQELHDVPIQDLYGLIYQVDDLKDYLKDTEGEQILNEHTQMLYRVVNNLRTICRELRPPSLSPFGLEVAIRDHAEKLRDQNPQLMIHMDLMRDQQVLSDSLRLNLFRIYQQAISNVIRHAEATEVHVRFRWDDNMILLEVEDNGKGFEVPNSWIELVRREHFGLVGLAERLESIRGKLEVVSAVGNGTLVRAIVPRH
jgi:signal transduction histidine kinase